MKFKYYLSFLLFINFVISWNNKVFSSFPRGTLIATPRGLIDIENLKVRDKVTSLKLDGSITEVPVTKIHKHRTDTLFLIYTNKSSNTSDSSTIWASPHQAFYDPIRESWIEAQHISSKNVLVNSNLDKVKVVKRESLEFFFKGSQQKRHVYVYALTLEAPHVFFISANSSLILTHNGLPAIAAGATFAFGSTPSSISFVEAMASAGGVSTVFGPTGLAIGLATSLGYIGYKLFSKQKNKKISVLYEKADQKKNLGNDPNGGNNPKSEGLYPGLKARGFQPKTN